MPRIYGKKAELNGVISINRPTYSSGKEVITITVEDNVSHLEFLKVSISYDEFTRAITGLSSRPCVIETVGLDQVGKRYIREQRSKIIPNTVNSFEHDAVVNWLTETAQEPGWEVDTYMGSQRSISTDIAGNKVANYAVFRFEPIEGTDDGSC